MENEVSGIAKLGIVLIALAVLIGLGFGIFQISKSTANTGVGNVQAELDSVSQSAFTTYDQTTITGTMASSAVSDFEGESVAVLIATQAWVDLIENAELEVDDIDAAYTDGAGINSAYASDGENGTQLPVVWAYSTKSWDADDAGDDSEYVMKSSKGTDVDGAFINYNAILGGMVEAAEGVEAANRAAGTTAQDCTISGVTIGMAGIYFDSNCFRCTTGFGTDSSGKVMFNNIASNLSKTGRTEYIPSGAKFTSYLIKDASGTNMGVAFQQVSGN